MRVERIHVARIGKSQDVRLRPGVGAAAGSDDAPTRFRAPAERRAIVTTNAMQPRDRIFIMWKLLKSSSSRDPKSPR